MTQNAINNSASSMSIDNIDIDGNTISSTDTNGNIILAPDGSGEVSVTAAPIIPSSDRADSLGSATNSWDNVYADGVSFDDGTNILSNYEDPTSWTPSVEFGGGSVGITYDVQIGVFSRIGKLVFFTVSIDLSSKGSSTGNASLAGFPFTSSSTAGEQAISIPKWNLINLAASHTFPCARINVSTSTFDMQQSGDNVAFTNLTNADFANDTRLFIQGVVFID